MGEFLPLVHAALTLRARVVIVYHPSRAWGECPLDGFYKDVSTPALKFKTANSPRKNLKVLELRERWDGSSKRARSASTREKLLLAVEYLRGLSLSVCPKTRLDFLIQMRGSDKRLAEYYRTGPGCKSYGSARRHIPGLEKYVFWAHDHGKVAASAESDGKDFFSQVSPYLQAKSLILCHGAGMVWSLFLPPGGRVLELVPEKKKHNKDARWLARAAGATFQRVVVAPGARLDEKSLFCKAESFFFPQVVSN